MSHEKEEKQSKSDDKPSHAEVEEHDMGKDPEEAIPSPKASQQPELSTPRKCFILGLVWLGVMLTGIDETITATLLGRISTSLGAVDKFSWLSISYLLAVSISQPVSGHLTDIFGRRAGLLLCLALFAIGTLICGVSRSFGVFIFGRLLSGLGGGSLGTICAFIDCDLIPMERRALVEGFSNIIYGGALALGGVYGGYINVAIGWRWAFYIQTPVIVANAIGVFFFVKGPFAHSPNPEASVWKSLRRIDVVGSVTITVTIILLQLGLNAGSTSEAHWNQPLVIAPLVVAGCSFIAFIVWDSYYATEPVIPLRALAERTVASTHIAAFLSNAAVYAYLFYVPLYVQVQGGSTAAAGRRMLPFAAGVAFGSTVCGFAVNAMARYYGPNIAVQVVGVAAGVTFYKLDSSWGSWATYFAMALVGCYWGASFVIYLMSLLTSIKEEQQAVVQSSVWAVRSMGMTVGLAIVGSVFQSTAHGAVDTAQLEGVHGLANLSEKARQVSLRGIHNVFLAALCSACVAAAASFCVENRKISVSESSEANEMADPK